ncbi:unnamed protein product, partial [Ectocarpus sp. 12 AP-2014]
KCGPHNTRGEKRRVHLIVFTAAGFGLGFVHLCPLCLCVDCAVVCVTWLVFIWGWVRGKTVCGPLPTKPELCVGVVFPKLRHCLCPSAAVCVHRCTLVFVVVQLRSSIRSAFGGFISNFFPCAVRVLCSSALGALASSFCRRTCACCVRGVPLERCCSAYPIRKVSARACGLCSFRVSCSSRWSICPTPPHYTRENMPGGMAAWARVSRHDQCLPPPPPFFVLL